MSVQLSSNIQVWSDIVSGKVRYEFEFLALKILLGRLMLDVERDPAPATVQRCAEEIRALLMKNANLPSAKRDLQKIFGQ